MDGADLAFAGIARQAQLIRDREVSSRELVELYLGRIERLDPRLNAFRTVFAEQSLAAADAADGRRDGGAQAPMLGVPIAIKDELAELAGDVTRVGTDAFDEVATTDSEMVRRLRDAGAVIVGKTNLPELAICGFTESKTFGVTRNPWEPGRTPGGSSGGSAAAVAAGLVAGASGSDGAGSIRIPAALCGLFGLKPQRDRVPLGPPGDGVVQHWHGLSVNGCLTRSVADTALWLDVTAPRAPGGGSYAEAAATGPGRLRIGVSVKAPWLAVPPILDQEMVVAVHTAAELLAALGHRVDGVEPRYGMLGNRVTARYLDGIREDVDAVPHPERLERRTRGFARLGRLVAPPWLARRAVGGEAADAARVFAVFESCDVLLTPTVSTPPVEVGFWERAGALRTLLGMTRRYPFTVAWNHLGNPAASVPIGTTSTGLPLGVQLVGPADAEPTLLSLAAQIEAERPWADRRPPVS
ncbi:MAG: amiB2 [Solirubrobacterales bacterium]|nr:amiB2 [Solirubrobacterales bacterium]